jgi:hypothetical protein
MRHSRCSLTNADPSYPHQLQSYRRFTTAFFCFFIVCLLAACSGTAAASNQPTRQLTPTPTFTPTPTETPTPTPTPRPAATPKPRPPTPVPQSAAPTQPSQPAAPTQPLQPAPAPILDVAPSSMSIVGHLDCSRTTTVFVCQAGVLSEASNQATLHWVAFANVGGISFSPAQGNLAPGIHVILTIRIPVSVCSATFFFQGPANTHTIIWQC